MDLLDYLTTLLRCEYLSDLNYARIGPEQLDELRKLGDRCSVEDYNHALTYLTRRPATYKEPQQANEALIDFFSRKAE